MESIKAVWDSAPEDIKPPSIYILTYQNKFYAVVDDETSIIFVASKEKNILAVAKSKLKLIETQGVLIYYVEDIKVSGISPLKIVSCSLNTIKNKNQIFAIEKIVPALQNA
jgi:hypothetical protein